MRLRTKPRETQFNFSQADLTKSYSSTAGTRLEMCLWYCHKNTVSHIKDTKHRYTIYSQFWSDGTCWVVLTQEPNDDIGFIIMCSVKQVTASIVTHSRHCTEDTTNIQTLIINCVSIINNKKGVIFNRIKLAVLQCLVNFFFSKSLYVSSVSFLPLERLQDNGLCTTFLQQHTSSCFIPHLLQDWPLKHWNATFHIIPTHFYMLFSLSMPNNLKGSRWALPQCVQKSELVMKKTNMIH